MDLFRLHLSIPCGCGNLEGCLLYRDAEYQGPGVIICPPHPLLAGNMENNVVTTLAETIAPSLPVLLFNYRGVGRSCSPRPELPLYEYWQGVNADDTYQEVVEDVVQVLEKSASYFQSHHLIGYSFGSYIALQAANEKTVSFTAITPPLKEHNFNELAKLNMPKLIVLAEQDNLLQTANHHLPAYADKREIIQNTDHFFRKRETELAAAVNKFLLGQGEG